MKKFLIAKKLFMVMIPLCLIALCYTARSKQKRRTISSIFQTMGPEDGYYALHAPHDTIISKNKLAFHGIYDEVFSIRSGNNITTVHVKFKLQYTQLVHGYEMFPEIMSIDTTLVQPFDDNKIQKIGKLSEILTSKDTHNLELMYASDDNYILCYFSKKIASINKQGKIDIHYNNL